MKHSFCEDWEFTHHWTEAFGKGLPVPKQQAVRLPHTCREVPLHYATPADYEMVCGYRKRFRVPPVQAAPRLFLRFDGAAHQAVVRVNGRVAGQHRGGYTGFAVEITGLVDREGENLLTVLTTLFLSNSVDYGQLKTGRREEGVIFSMQTFVVKAASGVAVFLTGIGLDLIGLVGNTEETGPVAVQSAGTLLGLRLMMTVLPMLVLAGALVLFRRKFVLTDARAAEISAQLHGEEAHHD